MKIIEGEIKELHIQEIFKSPLKTMIKNAALHNSKLKWCNGFLLTIGGYDHFDELVKEQTNGVYRWGLLEYADMKDYSPTQKDEELHLDVAIVNASFSPFYQEVAKYIRENDKA